MPKERKPLGGPEPFPRERMARTGFQILLERFRLTSVGEGDVGDQFPRTMLGSMWGLSGIVLVEPRSQIRCAAHVALRWLFQARKEIDVVQPSSSWRQPCYAKASQGILLARLFQ